jgi:AraC-like DNA-binding protein
MTAAAAPEPDQALRLSFQTRDVDEYRSILSTHHAPVRAEPLSPALFTVGAVAVMTGGVALSRVICPTGIELAFDSVFDGYGLSLPATGSFAVRVAGRGMLETRQGMGLMMDSSLVTHAVLGPGTNLPRIAITSAEMHSKLAELIDQPILRRIRFAPDVSLASPAVQMANTLSRLVYEGMEGDAPLRKYPAALTSLREAILHLLLEGMPHSYSHQMSRQAHMPSPGHVKRAIDFMAANAAKPLRLSDIALASGTSVRSLQGGFMRFRGMSPMAYLRNLRLHGVRAELLAGGAGATVSHIAHTWGFPQLSSFSTLYMRAFGERPSATLRRASRG